MLLLHLSLVTLGVIAALLRTFPGLTLSPAGYRRADIAVGLAWAAIAAIAFASLGWRAALIALFFPFLYGGAARFTILVIKDRLRMRAAKRRRPDL